MFISATSFNSDVNAWNVASVTTMHVRNSACSACIATHVVRVVLLISALTTQARKYSLKHLSPASLKWKRARVINQHRLS